jgi:hypothetical protein
VFGAALSLGIASGAAAKFITIVHVGTGNGDLGNVTINGFGTPWTTPILMTDNHGNTYTVFCDDLYHVVYVEGGQSLVYDIGIVNTNGNGQSISEQVSNVMGQLAQIGEFDYAHGNEDGAIAAQAASWGDEYKTPVSSTDQTIENDITSDLGITANHGGWAYGLIAKDGQQSEVLGLLGNPVVDNLVGGAPEPASWALMLLGVFGAGAMLRRRPLAQVAVTRGVV